MRSRSSTSGSSTRLRCPTRLSSTSSRLSAPSLSWSTYVPLLTQRPNSIYSARDRIALYETLAIARYLDEILASKDAEDPSHRTLFPPPIGAHERNYADVALSRVEIDQICSLIMTRVQPIVEDRYVKPFFALRNNGASREDISAALSDSFQAAEEIFVLLERVIANTQEQLKLSNPEYIFGNLSWADVFLFPVARDFKATNPDLFTASRLPWLSAWFSRFEQRPSAVATLPTSFAASK